MTDKEKQKVTLSLKHGTLDILRQKAKEVGMLIERGSEAGNGNVSGYLDSLAWAEKNSSSAPSEYPLQRLTVGSHDVEFRAKHVAGTDGIIPLAEVDGPEEASPWFRYVYGIWATGDAEDIQNIAEDLYITEDSRYIVHVTVEWPDEETEFDECFVLEVGYEDLCPGGRFRSLGRQAGIEPAVSLDEALALQKQTVQMREQAHPVTFTILEEEERIADQAEDQE